KLDSPLLFVGKGSAADAGLFWLARRWFWHRPMRQGDLAAGYPNVVMVCATPLANVVASSTACAPLRTFPKAVFPASTLHRFNRLTWRSNFPRNLEPGFTHYLSEWPEMSSQ